MTRLRLAYPTIITAFLAPAAFADLTAEDVWKDWQANMDSFGYAYTADEARAPGQLNVTNLVVNSTMADEFNSAKITFESILLVERSDGSVSITMPAVTPIEILSTPEQGETVEFGMNLTQDGMRIIATGNPAALQYDYAANSVELTTTQIEINGEVMPADSNRIEARFSAISGRTDMLLDTMRRQKQTLSVGSLSYTFMISEPDEEAEVDVTGGAEALSFSGTSATPLEIVQANDMSAMLDAGFSVDGTFNYENGRAEVRAVSPQEQFAGLFAAETGSLDVDMNRDGLRYSATQTGLGVQMASGGIPVPIDATIERAGFSLLMPLRESESAQDFGISVELNGFTMSDMLWGLFDATGQLPRDPATAVVQLAGKGRLLFDFLDPEAAMISGNPNITPAEIDSVDINKLELSVAGASLTGTGAFVFENSAGSPPRPVGGVDLTLVGGNGLLDKLVAIGLFPEQQATGVRMMMGLLAVPGDAPDTLNSRLEINEQGHISANGQRIQ